MTDARLYAVLDSIASRIEAESDRDVYEIVGLVVNEIIDTPDIETEQHLGAAYVLWIEITDLYDSPFGPNSLELSAQVARTAATDWTRVNHTDESAIARFFKRWKPGAGETWRSLVPPEPPRADKVPR